MRNDVDIKAYNIIMVKLDINILLQKKKALLIKINKIDDRLGQKRKRLAKLQS